MTGVRFPSTKAAIACAANMARRLAYPSRTDTRVQASPDGDREADAIDVRRCLRLAGLDPDGEDAQLLYEWATTGDDAVDPDDALAAVAKSESESQQARARSAARESRRIELVSMVTTVLEQQRVVAKRLRKRVVGYRAIVDAHGPRVAVVIDPHPDDASVFRGPRARELAMAAAERGGEDASHHVCARPERRHPELAAELVPKWQGGDFETLGQLDAEVQGRLGCTRRYASLVRASWGIAGTMGRAPTLPGAA